jgi:hypothetical protein
MRVAAAIVLAAQATQAHAVDAYVQSALIDLTGGRVQIELRLKPGVAICPIVLALVDANDDGTISSHEGRTYAERVAKDLKLEIDGQIQPLRVDSARFPEPAELRAGMGDIVLRLSSAQLENGDHVLSFENRHQRAISVYLVNAIEIAHGAVLSQKRNESESVYELRYRLQSRLSFWDRAIAAFR